MAARLPARHSRRGPHHPGIQPPPHRGRPDRRPRDHHQPRPTGHRWADHGPDPPGHHPGRPVPQPHRKGRHPMTTAIRAELYKITTTRMTYGFAGIAVGLTALVTAVLSAQAGSNSMVPSLATAAGLRDIVTNTGFAM